MFLFVYNTIIIIIIIIAHFSLLHSRLAGSQNSLGITDQSCLIDSSTKNFLSIWSVIVIIMQCVYQMQYTLISPVCSNNTTDLHTWKVKATQTLSTTNMAALRNCENVSEDDKYSADRICT